MAKDQRKAKAREADFGTGWLWEHGNIGPENRSFKTQRWKSRTPKNQRWNERKTW